MSLTLREQAHSRVGIIRCRVVQLWNEAKESPRQCKQVTVILHGHGLKLILGG